MCGVTFFRLIGKLDKGGPAALFHSRTVFFLTPQGICFEWNLVGKLYFLKYVSNNKLGVIEILLNNPVIQEK